MATPPPPQYPQGPNNPNQPYPPAYGYAPPPPKKRKVWPWVLGIILLVILGGFAACVALVGGAVDTIDKETKREVTVTYKVTGTGTASITWTDQDFNMAQATDVALPWEKQVVITGLGKTASLSVTNNENAGAKSTCEIIVDGQVKYTQTATGPFASASCIGDVG